MDRDEPIGSPHLSGGRRINEPAVRAALEAMTFEIIPLKSRHAQLAHLPPSSRVSVTASPSSTLDHTLDVCAELLDAGHRPIPHLAARMVRDRSHLRTLESRMRAMGIDEIFCIAGDADQEGLFEDSLELIRDLLDVGRAEFRHVGVGAYPDGHATIDAAALDAALHEKDAIFAAADVTGHASTQMCFSADAVRHWADRQRASGLAMDIHLGLPGVVDRTRLLRMGMRIGIGSSLRYLNKNRRGLTRLLGAAYDPSHMVTELGPDFDRLGITAVHSFTFNQIDATRQWRDAALR